MKRRSFLHAALGSSVVSLLSSRLAAAAEASVLPRFVFIYTPAGRHPSWRTEAETTRAFKLGPTMTMFEPYRDKLCLLDGFTLLNFGYQFNSHYGGLHSMLSGRALRRRPGDEGGALSVASQRTFDHLLADRIGGRTPVRNIVIGGRDRDNGNGTNQLIASWTAPATPNHPIHDPDRAFAALFGAGDDETDAALRDPEAARRAHRLEQRVLGLSREQLASFKHRLGRHEQLQLGAYETHLHELADQVAREAPVLSRNLHHAVCKRPRLSDLTAGLDDSDQYAQHHDLQSRILAAALACGRTAVATYVMAGLACRMTVPGTTHQHHHHDDAAHDHYRAFDRYYGQRVKFLLDELAKYPEGTGSVLDHTVVLWTTDIAWTPNEHDHKYHPIYLFGGLPGGRLRMGQYLKVPYDDGGGDRTKALANPTNRRLHEVLLTLGAAIGQRSFDGFADPKYTRGPVDELLA